MSTFSCDDQSLVSLSFIYIACFEVGYYNDTVNNFKDVSFNYALLLNISVSLTALLYFSG